MIRLASSFLWDLNSNVGPKRSFYFRRNLPEIKTNVSSLFLDFKNVCIYSILDHINPPHTQKIRNLEYGKQNAYYIFVHRGLAPKNKNNF